MTVPKNVPGRADHGAPPPPFIKRARKFLVGVAGLAGTLAACEGLEGTEAGTWLTVGLAVATAAGIYRVPNAEPAA